MNKHLIAVLLSILLIVGNLGAVPVFAADSSTTQEIVETSEEGITDEEGPALVEEPTTDEEPVVQEDLDEDGDSVSSEDINSEENSSLDEDNATDNSESELDSKEGTTDDALPESDLEEENRMEEDQDSQEGIECENNEELLDTPEDDTTEEQEKHTESIDIDTKATEETADEIIIKEERAQAQKGTIRAIVSSLTTFAGSEEWIEYYDDSGTDGIISAKSSNTSVVSIIGIEDTSYYMNEGGHVAIFAKKPGSATVTITKPGGYKTTCTVNVESFLTTSFIAINSGKTKFVSILDDVGEKYMPEIESISSSDSKIAFAQDAYDYSSDADDYDVAITGKRPGTTTVTVTLSGGATSTVMIMVKPNLKGTTKTPTALYGTKKITGKTTPGAKVTAKVKGKTYKATANASGKYTVKIPVVKKGTIIKIKFTSAGTSLSKSIKVKKGDYDIYTTHWVFRDSTVVRGVATNLHKGDYIKVSIGGKTFRQKIKKDISKKNFKIKINKPDRYGIRLTTSVYNKFNQCMDVEKDYVYKGNTVYVGDSKETVRWLVDWNNPVAKNYTSYSEQWCYDWNGDGLHDAYLYFRDDKVTDWQIYN